MAAKSSRSRKALAGYSYSAEGTEGPTSRTGFAPTPFVIRGQEELQEELHSARFATMMAVVRFALPSVQRSANLKARQNHDELQN